MTEDEQKTFDDLRLPPLYQRTCDNCVHHDKRYSRCLICNTSPDFTFTEQCESNLRYRNTELKETEQYEGTVGDWWKWNEKSY